MKNSQCSLSIGCLEKWKNILFRSLLYTIQITSYQKTSGLSAVPLLRQQVSIFINQRSFGQRERIVDTDDQNDHRDFFGKKELYLPLDMLLQQHVIPPKWLLKKYHTRLLEQHPPKDQRILLLCVQITDVFIKNRAKLRRQLAPQAAVNAPLAKPTVDLPRQAKREIPQIAHILKQHHL